MIGVPVVAAGLAAEFVDVLVAESGVVCLPEIVIALEDLEVLFCVESSAVVEFEQADGVAELVLVVATDKVVAGNFAQV